ncbi:MAG: Nucleotidyltransferase domain protein [Candidatus Argoarchaeum ethanivorans]|uniref:Nucleotidyltransferase domain protein n=1 Tax=Candidatus Argoarchaeum ethanivorans TaxID=2608793 RepID=A0A811TA17_9EURY|nr:MAG: Nucleotidyltransferase domain protein [Candidatus Argoarchaeum ethanivorans]
MSLKQIKNDLALLKGCGVVIFGSYTTGDFREGSDIDIAIITRNNDYGRNLDILKSFIGMAPVMYDIWVFELLPLKIKASVMDNYTVLYGKLPEISEYFYQYRKLWDDCKHRVAAGYFGSYREQVAAIQRFRRFRNRPPQVT